MKISPVGTELFHADRRTDVTKLIAFRSFANAPKNLTFGLRTLLAYLSKTYLTKLR